MKDLKPATVGSGTCPSLWFLWLSVLVCNSRVFVQTVICYQSKRFRSLRPSCIILIYKSNTTLFSFLTSASTDTILPGNYMEEFVITTIFSGKMTNEKIILIYSKNPETCNDVHTCILKSESHLPKKFFCFNRIPLKMMKDAFYFILYAFFILKVFIFFKLFGHVGKVA